MKRMLAGWVSSVMMLRLENNLRGKHTDTCVMLAAQRHPSEQVAPSLWPEVHAAASSAPPKLSAMQGKGGTALQRMF